MDRRDGGPASQPELWRSAILSSSIDVANTLHPLLRRSRAMAAPSDVGLEHPVIRATFCFDMVFSISSWAWTWKRSVIRVVTLFDVLPLFKWKVRIGNVSSIEIVHISASSLAPLAERTLRSGVDNLQNSAETPPVLRRRYRSRQRLLGRL